MELKNKIIHILFSNKFYDLFLKPFDKIKYPVINNSELKVKRKENPIPINKITNVSDIFNKEWENILLNMKDFFFMDARSFHRKIWEYVHIIYVLKKKGYLYPSNKALAIGAGRENILFYLANKISKITGIDIYEGKYLDGEDNKDVPLHPEKYAPFLYPKKNLELIKMDSRKLDFEDNTFDFVFSCSSIEHFGPINDIKKSIDEMYRVLKPGGACVITTELKLNRLGTNISNTKIFELDKLVELLTKSNFKINKKNIDINIEENYLKNWVKLPMELIKRPHAILRFFNTIFTSISLFLSKPGGDVKRGAWKEKFNYTPLNYCGEIKVKLNKYTFTKGERANIKIFLKNNSNFDWFTDGNSHRIAIGIQLCDTDGNTINPNFKSVTIPDFIKEGRSKNFETNFLLDINPGKYQLLFDLKRELICWFNKKGNPPFICDIEVI